MLCLVFIHITACSLTKERWDKSKQSHSRSKKLQDEEITLNGESQLDHVSHQTDRGEMIKESEIESPGDLDIQVIPPQNTLYG